MCSSALWSNLSNNPSFSPSSHPCASRISRTAPKRTLVSAKSSLSDLTSRPPLSGSNRIIPQPQHRYVGIIYLQSLVNTSKCSAEPSDRHYPHSSKDNEAFPSCHSDPLGSVATGSFTLLWSRLRLSDLDLRTGCREVH
jgi:hypothetical protein